MTTEENYKNLVKEAWEGLKDFQKDTVEFVYNRFYRDGHNKFLVADEVGLGKTLVAKGIIVKAFESFKPSKTNPTFNVIYICSNQTLAHENLLKLNFTGDDEVVEDPLNRLVYLALERKNGSGLLRFDSLTPSTSLTISNRSGTMKERAIIYTLLSHYEPFKNRRSGLKWLLIGGAQSLNWDAYTKYYSDRKDFFRPETFQNFRRILFETELSIYNMPRLFLHRNSQRIVSVWTALLDICSEISSANHHQFKFKNEIIVYLRHLLTKVCLRYLSADLIILDEFQRYAEILETDENKMNPAVELARAVFNLEGTKVLMLSATPFKPYTTLAERDASSGGEEHYRELKKVLKFLMQEKSGQFWNEFEKDRNEFFQRIFHPHETLDSFPEAIRIKNRLQEKYKEGIVRTERNKVSDDRNALVKSFSNEPIRFEVAEIDNFLAVDSIFQKLKEKGKYRLPAPVDYCKSVPCPLSFSEGYQFRINLDEQKNDTELRKMLSRSKSAWIDISRISKYKTLGTSGSTSIVANSKMQMLIDDLNASGSWKWLWMPPTISYYKPSGIFPENPEFSKSLIFSSWKMVPRAISSIISYEAERLAMAKYAKVTGEKNESYFAEREEGKKRKPAPLLNFRKKAGNEISASMSLFTLLYPSVFLIDSYDPELNLSNQASVNDIYDELAEKIKNEFYRLNLNKFCSSDGIPERWYWAAPILLDRAIIEDNDGSSPIPEMLKSLINSIGKSGRKNSDEGTPMNEQRHIGDLTECYLNPENIGLGKLPEDLFQKLSLMCLGSPAICFARSILKQFRDTLEFENLFIDSWLFARSKVHFFNKPENIAVVKSFYPDINYWEAVLNYCAEGNLQSSLDEFIHLQAGSGFNSAAIREFYSDILSLRTATNKVDDYNSYSGGKVRKIRTHYAIDFGTQDLQTESGTGRLINVRQAFNSPYRPFILASTSIGQEGLDFHYYCAKVIHWNLPSNAIDIEQREGRINRFKGLIIRRNVVNKYLLSLKSSNSDEHVWDSLFSEALKQEGKCKNKCELVPFWHIEPVNNLKIERIVPLYPFSKDIQKYRLLTETLTYYRLTFGQPRQEELVETLYEAGLSPEQIELLRKNLLIDLSP